MSKKEVLVDIRAYLPPTTNIFVKFDNLGLVSASVIKADHPNFLYAELANNSGAYEFKDWITALREGTIIINPN